MDSEKEFFFNVNINNTESNGIRHSNSAYVHILAVCLAIVFVLGLMLNIVSIGTILKTKKMQPTFILILNLAFADILYILG